TGRRSHPHWRGNRRRGEEALSKRLEDTETVHARRTATALTVIEFSYRPCTPVAAAAGGPVYSALCYLDGYARSTAGRGERNYELCHKSGSRNTATVRRLDRHESDSRFS